jgi:N-ethylmaleimide reductase
MFDNSTAPTALSWHSPPQMENSNGHRGSKETVHIRAVGLITLKHRVVMPPMSRLRVQPGTGIPSDLMLECYSQRASDGGLIVTETTAISASARGYYHASGVYTDEHVVGRKRITDAIHSKGA